MIDQNQDRTKFIGGSDIAKIMGISQFGTPLSVWSEKTGTLPPKDLSDIEAVQIGIELEEYVARKFQRASGYKVRVDNRTFTHPKYDFMAAHIDRWIVGEDALLECKTTSAWNAKKWEGEEIPSEYVLQVNWYLGIVKKKIGYIAVLLGVQRFFWKMIEFSQELFDRQVEAARDFWQNYVLPKIAPMAMSDDTEIIAAMFAESNSSNISLDENRQKELDDLIEARFGGLEQKKLIEEEVDKLSNQIRMILGEAEACHTSRFAVTWKNQARSSVDTEKLKSDGLYEKYSKATSSRILRTVRVK
jgi:putative phage-type endonuclease